MIRKATIEDAQFVAWTVLTALDLDTSDLDKTTRCCADENAMYSYRNALIATDENDKPIGCIVSYPGDDYIRLREYTWPIIWSGVDEEVIRNTPHETEPGEYYLDSMAILPEARGNGLGMRLMEAAMEHGRDLGYGKFSLIVDVDKPHLRDYYATLGFKAERMLPFLHHDFTKMTLS